MTKRSRLLPLLGSLLAIAVATPAWATVKVKKIEFLPAGKPDPKTPNVPALPTMRAKVSADTPNLKANQFHAKLPDMGDKPPLFDASGVVAFKDSDEDLNVIILVQENFTFMGGSHPDPDNPTQTIEAKGAYDQVRASIDTLTHVRQRKTKIGLSLYGDKVVGKVTLGDPKAVSPDAIGPQSDFATVRTAALKLGIESSIATLTQATGRKIIVVIGDGDDTDIGVNVQDTMQKLNNAEIELYALVGSPRTLDPKNKTRMEKLSHTDSGGGMYVATEVDQIPQQAEIIANSINNQYTVDIPGVIADSGQTMMFDGQQHDVVIVAGKDESESFSAEFPLIKAAPPPKPAASHTWLWILLGVLGVLGLGVVALVLLGGKKEEEVVPEPVAAPPPTAAAPPPVAAPPAPMKTMMIGVGGGDDSMPVVGWIVPMSGPAQFQTLKLQQGKTTIGTAPDCNIVVQDPFMSVAHCDIVMAPDGFKLLDRGSTNGSMVNSKRVQTHDLVDNDVITLGKTDFKFKSIN